MTLNELTHATVEQCDEAIAESWRLYYCDLAATKQEVLYPARKLVNARNAAARKRKAYRVNKLLTYRAILATEQPGGSTNE